MINNIGTRGQNPFIEPKLHVFLYNRIQMSVKNFEKSEGIMHIFKDLSCFIFQNNTKNARNTQ